ncbi:LysM peptidoglycan-binding domain-containing protein [Coraliomargarita akajimensis]|uniref:Peptidoglycan-binding lysin domain protein n=1 Tax=Coraliomargarita akajimensis (strain DSM 45221 / IAM 15411 / JCM 23193 / KCTC 12865 / 04OKA010-24) TaxID=583355 RepID=D5EHT4_CORAD|nr:LysM domain-containing protein [Coraliomargarita akajimensis]ADE54125.1 Peptidoglycan-binding lysin domain protein [Coraliomargarita akajimensis DSM 45221]
MEDDVEVNESSSQIIPIALAVLAVVVGGAGLYFGMTANQRIAPLSESLNAGVSSSAQLEKTISKLETRVEELTAANQDLRASLKRANAYDSQRDQALKKLEAAIRDNREQIVKSAEQVNSISSSTVSEPAATDVRTPESSAPTETVDTASTASGVYVIESGDTLQRVSNTTGISLQAILDANPGIDPRRLRIGQQITLPSN